MTKHKSGAEKRKKRKRENELIETQRGALNRYFPAASSVDVNETIQRQESEVGQDEDHNSNVDHEVNDQSFDDSK